MGGKDGSPGGGAFHWYDPLLLLLVLGGPWLVAIYLIDRFEHLGAWVVIGGILFGVFGGALFFLIPLTLFQNWQDRRGAAGRRPKEIA